MQQAVGRLKVSNLIAANRLLLEIEKLEANMKFCSPQNLAGHHHTSHSRTQATGQLLMDRQAISRGYTCQQGVGDCIMS